MAAQSIILGRMDHVALPTRDAALGEQFYCNVLGFKTVSRPSFTFDGRWLVHETVGVMLHLIHNDDLAATNGAINSLGGHFAIRCADIDMAIAVLEQHGVGYVEKRLPDYGYRQLFLRDPDGNVLELGEWPEKS